MKHGFEEKGTPKVGFVMDKHVFREQRAMCTLWSSDSTHKSLNHRRIRYVQKAYVTRLLVTLFVIAETELSKCELIGLKSRALKGSRGCIRILSEVFTNICPPPLRFEYSNIHPDIWNKITISLFYLSQTLCRMCLSFSFIFRLFVFLQNSSTKVIHRPGKEYKTLMSIYLISLNLNFL